MATPPKKNLFPFFLFLLLLSTLFIFTLYPSTVTTTSSSSGTQYSLPSAPSKFTLIIKVLTFNRLSSLSRCLRSLAAAPYDNDTVHLHIYLDHFNISSAGSQEIDAKLNLSREILKFLDSFKWVYGQKLVHYRTANAGLQAQWLESWWPSSDHEFAFVVEDDLEVSPQYYKFLKGLILNYYYNESNFSPMIYGASLQRPRFVPGKRGNKIKLDSETRLFLYQLVGTWGQLLFPRPWKEFRLWYDEHKAKGTKPVLDGMVTTGWYKKMGEKIWTPWFIKFIHARGYFNIYTNLLGERALSVSHRDAGVNYGKTAGPDSHLLGKTSTDFNLLEFPSLNKLKWYDFCFSEVRPDKTITSFNGFGSILHNLQKSDTVVLVSLFRASEAIIMNFLCHLEKLNTHNYILMGPKSNFLLDLARRGHPVVDAAELSNSIGHQNLLQKQNLNRELIDEITVKAFVIRKCLELGYTTWIVDTNVIPISNDSFSNSLVPGKDFYVGETSNILCVRGSSSAQKVWVDDFVNKLVAIADSSRKKDLLTVEDDFVLAVKQLLQQMSIKFDLVDDMHFLLNVDSIRANQTLARNLEKFVSWSLSMGSDIIQKKLTNIGLWAIDNDLSCSAVVCHRL